MASCLCGSLTTAPSSSQLLDIEDSQILSVFQSCLRNTACVSLELNMPTVASVPYSILLAFSHLLAVVAETEFTFKEAEEIKAYLADPSAFASAAGPAAATTGAAAAVEEESEEEEMTAGPGLFEE